MPEKKEQQLFFEGPAAYRHLPDILRDLNCKRPLVVCGKRSFSQLGVSAFLEQAFPGYLRFQDFSSNPDINDAHAAKKLFLRERADSLVAIGGGSAIDVAKAVKYHLEQAVPLVAMPTTAGTGSESTQFAVVYENHVKQSLDEPALLPDAVILDPVVLVHLPAYQRASTVFDAMCQAIESWWSVHATNESRAYAKEAIALMMPVLDAYLEGERDTFSGVLKAANLAGRAINITRTTAPHAMSYALTTTYGIAHGHAVTLLLPHVWSYMAERTKAEGMAGLNDTFAGIANALFSCGVAEAIERLNGLNFRYGMTAPENARKEDLEKLCASVNEARLKNNPVLLSGETIANIYKKALLFICTTSA